MKLTGHSFEILCAVTIVVVSYGFACSGQTRDSGLPLYNVVHKYPIPGDQRWDYISFDGEARRLYVSHETEIEVLDADSGKSIGVIGDTPGVHGAAIATDLGRGFTSNGGDGSVTIFSTETLATVRKVPLGSGTDPIVYDSFSKHVFPLDQKTTVLDARTGDIVGRLDLGGDPHGGVSDGAGKVFAVLADRAAIVVIDSKALVVTKIYPVADCTKPHSLAFDFVSQRLFVGCSDSLVAVDATTGRIAGRSVMCSGVDSASFDRDDRLIFEACREGVISVLREVTPDFYDLVETIPTQLWAKAMAFDPRTKNIYLSTAEFEPVLNTDPKFLASSFRRNFKPGSFGVLVLARQ